MDVPERVPEFDLYGELEVSATASAETIDAAWRSLVKRHHPDAARESAGAMPSDERIRRLNIAHDWLSDPDRRARYDRERALRSSTVPPASEPVTTNTAETVDWREVRESARRHAPPSSSSPRSLVDSPILAVALGVLAIVVVGGGILVLSRATTTAQRSIAEATQTPVAVATITPRPAATPDAASALADTLPDEVAGIGLVGETATGAEAFAGDEALDDLIARTGGTPDDLVGAYKAGESSDGRIITVVALALTSVPGDELAAAFADATTVSEGVSWSPEVAGGRSVVTSRDPSEPEIVAYLLSSATAMYVVIASDAALADATIRALP